MKENIIIGFSSIAIILSIVAILMFLFVPISNISENAISERHLTDNSITADQIVDGIISDDKISNAGISKISDSSIDTNMISDNTIKTNDLENDVLNWENIKNKPLEVVAAGKISRTGQIYEGYNVESVIINETYLPMYVYDITLIDIDYNEGFYITVITPVDSSEDYGIVRNYNWLRVVFHATGYFEGSEFNFVVYDIM